MDLKQKAELLYRLRIWVSLKNEAKTKAILGQLSGVANPLAQIKASLRRGLRWAPAEDAQLRDFFEKGETRLQISEKLQRTKHAITLRLIRFGLIFCQSCQVQLKDGDKYSVLNNEGEELFFHRDCEPESEEDVEQADGEEDGCLICQNCERDITNDDGVFQIDDDLFLCPACHREMLDESWEDITRDGGLNEQGDPDEGIDIGLHRCSICGAEMEEDEEGLFCRQCAENRKD